MSTDEDLIGSWCLSGSGSGSGSVLGSSDSVLAFYCLFLLFSLSTTRSRSFLSHHMSALGLSRKSRLFSKTSSISEELPTRSVRSAPPAGHTAHCSHSTVFMCRGHVALWEGSEDGLRSHDTHAHTLSGSSLILCVCVCVCCSSSVVSQTGKSSQLNQEQPSRTESKTSFK